MFTNIKKLKTIILLSLMFLMVFNVGGWSQNETEPAARSMPLVQENTANRWLRKLMSLILAHGEIASSMSDFGDRRPAIGILDPHEFGRENPFMPLTVKKNAAVIVDKTTKKTAQTKLEPTVHLTAIFAANGSQKNEPAAIIEEDGVSRTVFVGDAVAGMTILEIRKSEVILTRGNKKCVITLGMLFKNGS